MRILARLIPLLLLALLALAVVQLTMAVASADTGNAEKVVLIGVIAACVYLATRVRSLVDRLTTRQGRL